VARVPADKAKKPAKPAKPAGPTLGEKRAEAAATPVAPVVPAPVALDAVLGQQRAIAMLTDALVSERVHHAWIFQGPAGVGKFTTALAFAALVLDGTCEKGLTGGLAPDPESRVQQMLRAGSHPDLGVVSKEWSKYHPDAEIRAKKQTNIPVDVVRYFVLDPGRLAPTVAGGGVCGRVFIIDGAEFLADQSQNALLKFLEEPPPGVAIILVTSAPEALLPTIRSRCQRVPFRALPPDDLRRWARSRPPEAPPIAEWMLPLALGSPGALAEIAGTSIAGWHDQLEPVFARVLRGSHVVEAGPRMHELTEAWAKERVEASGALASKEAANRAAAEWMFRYTGWRLAEELARAAGAGDARRAGDAARAIDALRTAESEAEANVNTLFVMDKMVALIADALAVSPRG